MSFVKDLLGAARASTFQHGEKRRGEEREGGQDIQE